MDDGTLTWSSQGDESFADAAQSRPPAVGELLGGRFLLKEVLGKGGAGLVFAALDTRINQEVAVKVLHPHLVGNRGIERLRREIRAARGSHPHTVALFDLHSAGGLHFLSMELVRGRTLREWIVREGPLDPGEVIRIGAQLAAALAAFHAVGVIHRDVKPANVLITEDGEAKLCDMGLARPLESGLTVTETAMVVGTPAYMAPEQATGRELTPAVDVYALGLTLFAMLTGEPPLQDTTALSTLMLRQRRHAPPVRQARPDCPRWLSRLISRMLETAPAGRPSAARVQRSLENRAYGFWIRRRFLAAALALVALAVGSPLAYSRFHRTTTVQVVKDTTGVHGIDARGRTTWSFDLGAPVGKVLEADLDGDDRPEMIVSSRLTQGIEERRGPIEPSTIAVLGATGRVLTSADLRKVIPRWPYPYREDLRVLPQVMDLDGDGLKEVVVTYQQLAFYPSGIVVYWPRWKVWEQVLAHNGHIDGVAPARGGRPGLVFSGVNNKLCMFRVLGSVRVVPPSSPRARASRTPLGSPEEGLGGTASAGWHWYTMLAQPIGGAMAWRGIRLETRRDGDVVLGLANGRTFRIDRYGNPEGSPNWGRDLSKVRCAFFMASRYLAGETTGMSSRGIGKFVAELEAREAPLLEEKPYRIILGLRAGRALARVDDLDAAVAMLRRTLETAPNEDVVYRLAQIEAIAGRLREAAAELAPVLAAPRTPRGTFDVPQLGIRLGMERHDRPLVSMCVGKIVGVYSSGGSSSNGLAAALMARAHLWWDEIGPADLTVRSYCYEPAGEALAVLCRWRAGDMAPDDVENMRRFSENNPDARVEAQLAEAAAQLAAGRPGKARAVLDREIPLLEMRSRDDFFHHQLLDLARAIRCKALLAAGHRTMAKEAATELLVHLTPGLLPAHLAREVLAAAG